MTGRGARRGRPPRKKPRLPKRAPRDLSRPVERLVFPVDDPEERGARIDRFLIARLPWRSRASIVALLAEERVRVNGEVVTKKAARVQLGDRVEVEVPPPDEEVRHAEIADRLAAAVLFEDEHLLAVAKPAGLVAHPVGRIRANTLIQGLHWLLRHTRGGGDAAPIPRICHRLDRETSGVVVVAKDGRARAGMQAIFEERRAEKEYLALVAGDVSPGVGEIDRPLGPALDAPVDLMMAVREDGVPARTTYRVQERFGVATAVRFQLHTGRQHQIRVHALSIGHPVLCDALYGTPGPWPSSDDPLLTRQALHAARLAFLHPITGAPVVLEAETPPDLAAALERLRAGG